MGFCCQDAGEPPCDPPAGAPWEFTDAHTEEVRMAVDFADETGLRDTIYAEWDRTVEAIATDQSEEIFARRDTLEAAQALISE